MTGRSSAAVLSGVFFLSGASALAFETLWFRQVGLVVGNGVWATALVLTSFMAGLALGNALAARFGGRLGRPIHAYALLELAIAASGLALVWLLPPLAEAAAPLFRPLLDRPLLLNPLRLALTFGLLLVPATAMGATLPVLVKALHARDPHFGRVLGRLYGWNTLGAVAGALAGELLLIELLGIRGTGLVAAGLDVVAAAGALAVARAPAAGGAAPAGGAEAARVPLSPAARRVLAAAFLTGFTLLALEVVWFRFFSMRVASTAAVQAVLLASVLLGIGLGGLTAARWLRSDPEAARFLIPLVLGSGVLTVASYAGFYNGDASELVELWWSPLRIAGYAARLMMPVAFVSGILFTLLGEAAGREIGSAARAAGLLTMANTVGAMLGPLVAGFLLLPQLGMEASFFSLALVYGLVALLLPRPARERRGSAWRLALMSALALFALHTALFPFGLMARRYFAALALRFGADGSRPVALREGTSQTILYMRRDFEDLGVPAYYRLCTDSFWMSSTATSARRYMKLFVYLPVALHPAPRQALLISFGVGMTARALADTAELERVDVVDTSREILEMSGIVFPDPARHPLRDPRVHVHVEDGRHFLQATERRYDLITGEPPPPKIAGVVSLYTREYFGLIHERLAEGGITTYWLPVHAMGVDDSRAILRAFCDVFADCSLWVGSGLDWMMVGSRGAGGPVGRERFARQWRDPAVAPELEAVGLERPEQLGTLFLAGPERLAELTRTSPPLTDDRPRRLSVRADRDWLLSEAARHRELLDVAENARAFAESPLVSRLFPRSVREASLTWFATRAPIDAQSYWAPPDTRGLDALYTILDATELRTLPLWMLQSSVARQRAVAALASRGRREGLADWQGIAALSERSWGAAAAAFARARAERPGPGIVQMRALALALAGRGDELEGLLEGEVHAPFRTWLGERLGIDAS